MTIRRLIAAASLAVFAFALAPIASAQNDAPSSPPAAAPSTGQPHKTVDPAKRAARKAKRQQQHAQRMKQQQQPPAGGQPTQQPAPATPSSN